MSEFTDLPKRIKEARLFRFIKLINDMDITRTIIDRMGANTMSNHHTSG